MNTIHYNGGFWPTSQQELLLRAALLPGKEAIDAWREWKSGVDVDQLDPGSLRLLAAAISELAHSWNKTFPDEQIQGGLPIHVVQKPDVIPQYGYPLTFFSQCWHPDNDTQGRGTDLTLL